MRTPPAEMVRVFGSLRATFLQTSLRTCSGAFDGYGPRPRKTNGKFCPESDGFGPTQAIPSLPPGLEPGEMVRHEGEPRPVGVACRSFRPEWTAGGGCRRDAGAPPGKEDPCQGGLSGPGALFSRPLRESQRSEVGVPDAARSGAVGLADVGLTVPLRPGPFRTVRHRARQTP